MTTRPTATTSPPNDLRLGVAVEQLLVDRRAPEHLFDGRLLAPPRGAPGPPEYHAQEEQGEPPRGPEAGDDQAADQRDEGQQVEETDPPAPHPQPPLAALAEPQAGRRDDGPAVLRGIRPAPREDGQGPQPAEQEHHPQRRLARVAADCLLALDGRTQGQGGVAVAPGASRRGGEYAVLVHLQDPVRRVDLVPGEPGAGLQIAQGWDADRPAAPAHRRRTGHARRDGDGTAALARQVEVRHWSTPPPHHQTQIHRHGPTRILTDLAAVSGAPTSSAATPTWPSGRRFFIQVVKSRMRFVGLTAPRAAPRPRGCPARAPGLS